MCVQGNQQQVCSPVSFMPPFLSHFKTRPLQPASLQTFVIVICLPTEHLGVTRTRSECPCIPGSIRNLEKLVFEERGSTRRKTSRSRVENQQQTQPTNYARATLVGGGRSHHYAIPANGPGSSLSREHWVVFPGKTLCSHSV